MYSLLRTCYMITFICGLLWSVLPHRQHDECSDLCHVTHKYSIALSSQATTFTIHEDLREFTKHEESFYCHHIKALMQLKSDEFPVTYVPDPDSEDTTVDIVSVTPFRAVVYADNSNGIIVWVQYGSQVHFRCTSCSAQSRCCSHVSAFTEWTEDTEPGSEPLLMDNYANDTSNDRYQSVSQRKIPYPLPISKLYMTSMSLVNLFLITSFQCMIQISGANMDILSATMILSLLTGSHLQSQSSTRIPFPFKVLLGLAVEDVAVGRSTMGKMTCYST